MNTEDNNLLKERSREQIAIIANDYFKDQKQVNMLDFLGSGVGADYYYNNIKNLYELDLIEKNKSKVIKYINEHKAECFCVLNDMSLFVDNKNNVQKISRALFHRDIYDHLGKKKYQYDILNLDFCAPYYYRENKTKIKSTVEIFIQAFLNKSIKDNGLLFTTLQIRGRAANIIKETIREKEDISANIISIAEILGYKLEEVFAYAYKSSKATKMLTLGYRACCI